LQEQGGKTKSCEIEALRAGGGQSPGALHHIICRGIERRKKTEGSGLHGLLPKNDFVVFHDNIVA
jgi:hypothetical protein